MTVVDDILREFREFRRYTGDNLPGEPTNAPLPVGDPQSGPWNPKKANLRLALGNLAQQLLDGIALVNGMIPAITSARDAALSAIANDRTSALAAITTNRDAALTDIAAGRSGALSDINSLRNAAVTDVNALVVQGQAARDLTLAARDLTLTYRDDAQGSKMAAKAAAEASGPVVFFDTKAAADAAAAGLPADQVVEIFNDETAGGARTRYRKEGSALAFKTEAGMGVEDLYLPSYSTSVRTRIREGLDLTFEPRMFKEGVQQGNETADTDALIAAWAYATNPSYFRVPAAAGDRSSMVTKGPTIYLREGEFKFGAAGLPMATGQSSIATLVGAGQGATRVALAAGSRLIDAESPFTYFEARDFHVVGGAGAFRFRSEVVSANRGAIIERLTLSNYTVCAVEDASQDNPYFKVRDLTFVGHAAFDTIGLAIAGLRAGSVVEACAFLRNRYHLKLAPVVISGGPDKGPATPITLIANDFIRNPGRQDNGRGANTFGIWIVPNADSADNAGRAILCMGNKHGNENVQPGDAHILVADQEAGTYLGDRMHSTAASTGYVNGLAMLKDNVNFAQSPRVKMVQSYTQRIFNWDLQPIWDNNNPDYVCEYAGTIDPANFDKQMATNRVSFAQGLSFANGNVTPRLSNIAGTWNADDPMGYSGDQDVPLSSPSVSDRGDYANLLTGAFATNNASKVDIADEDGMPNGAMEVTITAEAGRVAASLAFATTVEGRLAWIEGSLKQALAQSVDRVRIRLMDASNRVIVERVHRIGANWRRFRLPWTPNKTGQTGFSLRFEGLGYAAGLSDKFQVGLAAVYHGARPQRDNVVSADNGDANATLNAGASASTQIWSTPLTATRVVTLATSTAYNGARFRIVRTAAATGAFNLNVGSGPLISLAPGNWCEVEYDGTSWFVAASSTAAPSISGDNGDATSTMTAGISASTQVWNTPLTANRTAGLSTTGARNGSKFRIVRTAAATGAFNLNVGTGPLKQLGPGSYADVEFNGAAWVLTGYGTL